MTQNGTVFGGLQAVTGDVAGGIGGGISDAITGTTSTVGDSVGGFAEGVIGPFLKYGLVALGLVLAAVVLL